MNSETAGKVCKALEIKNCFENSSFEKYNAEIKGKEEENKTTKNNNGLLNTSFLFWLIKWIFIIIKCPCYMWAIKD